MTTATADLCDHPLPAGRRCGRDAGHRGLHAADVCGHRWGIGCRLFERHRCDLARDQTHVGPCRCRCGATSERTPRHEDV